MLLLFFSLASYVPVPTCKEILQNTISAVEKIQTIKFHLKCNERINGKLIPTQSQIKLNRIPRKLYVYLQGPELLWVSGKNEGKVLVSPGGFPYVNVSLDPYGSIMRENQHHTIHEAGFEYFADIIKTYIGIAGDKFDSYFKYTGTISCDGHDCYFITAEYPDFKYVEYIVQKGETYTSIARKFKLSDYMLLEANSGKANGYNDIKPGQKIKIPNVYCSKIILYIDKELFIPRAIKIYDEKGLFEAYEYHDLEVNPKIPDEEFTKEYKGYKF